MLRDSSDVPVNLETAHMLQSRLSGVKAAMRMEARDRLDGDPVAKAFFNAASWHSTESTLEKTLLFALEQRVNMGKFTKSHAFAELVFKAFHRICLTLDDYPYSEKYDDPLIWIVIIDEVVSTPLLEDILINDLLMDALTNIADRAVAAELLLHSEYDRLNSQGDGPRVLEVGSGDLHKLKLMSPEVQVPFQPITVVRGLGRRSRLMASSSRQLPFETAYINEKLQTKKPFVGVGLDCLPMDEGNLKKAFADTHRPPELRGDNGKIERFKKFHGISPSNVTSYTGDFSESGITSLVEQTGIAEWDYIEFGTVLYLKDDPEIKQMLGLARELKASTGLIGVLDKVRPDPSNPSELRFFRRFDHFNLLIEDDGRLLDVMRFDSGRCREIKFGPDAIKLALYREMKRARRRIRGTL